MMTLAESLFDSSHYGLRVGKLGVASADELSAGLASARARGFDVVFARVPESTVAIFAPRAPLETLVTLKRQPSATVSSSSSIEEHTVLDEAIDLAAIAQLTSAITTSHLHADARLSRDRTIELYAAWAVNDARGRAQRMFVARMDGAIIGYLAALQVEGVAVIDLIAVEPRRHGGGIGGRLLHAFLAWSDRSGLPSRVGTQATNPALSLYRRLGFEPVTREVTFHLWLDEA